jgi:hypothetical protein
MGRGYTYDQIIGAAHKDDQYIVQQFIKGADVDETDMKRSWKLYYLDPNEYSNRLVRL